MNEDKYEIALKLYESSIDIYKYAFTTLISVAGAYFGGTAILFITVSGKEQTLALSLFLPTVIGFGLYLLFNILEYFVPSIKEWMASPLSLFQKEVLKDGYKFWGVEQINS